MSEKETSQKEVPQKIVTKYDRKVQRRKEAELKEKKRKMIDRIVGIVILAAVIIGLAFIPIRKYIATHSTYITVGGHDITQVEFDYYYNLASTDYINTYGNYLAYMGLNLTGDFASQSYSENMSWKDYFDQLAVDKIRQNKALIDAAKEAGFTYDTAKDYAAFEESLKDSASSESVSLGKYYKMTFGRYASASAVKPYVEEGYLAAAYYKSVAEANEIPEEEIQAYYDENAADYDSVDFLLTEVAAEIPEAQTVSDGNGGNTTVEPTEKEIQVAMDAAKEKADEALLVIDEEGTEQTGVLKSAISTKYNEWLFDEARKEGDTTIIEDTDSHKYYVLKFEKRYLDETATATVRAIMTTGGNGEAILTEWKDAGSTEEAFISLVEKYSEDTYTNTNGGLYEELTKSTLRSTLSDWIFAEGRKAGDTTVLTEDNYTYVLYFVENGRPEWQAKIANTLLSEVMGEYLTGIKEACTVEDPKGHLVYLKVQANESTATEAGNEGTETASDETTETASTETASTENTAE